MVRIFSQYVSLKSILLVMLEGVLMALALICAVKTRFWNDPATFRDYTILPEFGLQAAILVAVFQVCFYYNDLYNLSVVRRRSELLIRLWQSLGAGCLILGLLYFLAPALVLGRGVFFITVLIVLLAVTSSRILIDSAWQAASSGQNTLIVGTGQLALTLAREITERDDLGMRLVGFLDRAPVNGTAAASGPRVVGSTAELEVVARRHQIARIIVALEDRRGALPVRDLARLRLQGVKVEDAQSALSALSGRICLETLRPSWFAFSEGFRRSRLTVTVKRAADVGLGAAGLLGAAPLMLLIAIAIRLDSPGRALYRQRRVGLGGRCFELLKFRSMRADAERENGVQWAERDDPRVTRVGGVLRKFRLDELPQFLNVLRGDMSFVGPRPERPEFVDVLRERIPFYDERHSVRPGLTGWAQVQYAYGASVEDALRKLEYDLFYLKNMSPFFDAAIILQTVRIVLFGRGGR